MEEVGGTAGGPWLSVGWRNGTPEPSSTSLGQGAAFASVLARTLAAAGYEPRRLDVQLQRGALGRIELHILGDVPGLPLADFDSLAQVTLHALRLRKDLAGADELVVVAHLEQADEATARPSPPSIGIAATAAQPSPTSQPQLPPLISSPARTVPWGRLVTGVLLGLFLGVVGLPRLDISLPQLPRGTQTAALANATPIPQVVADVDNPRSRIVRTAQPTLTPPTPTVAPLERAAAVHSGVLFAERFASPLANWPNDPNGTAWFADGALHLLPRQAGRFVAIGVPHIGTIGNGTVGAQFRKASGPAGGGYGLIIRDQAGAAERDSYSQAGDYIVLEVGDRGDIGVWRRDQLRWIDIVPWSHSDAVRIDEPNTLLVSTAGNNIRFEVNGEVVALVSYDGLPATGGVGIFVGGDLNEVALEWLRIETL